LPGLVVYEENFTMKDAKTPDHDKASGKRPLLWILVTWLLLAVVTIILAVKIHSLDAKLADTQKQLTQAKSDGAEAQAELDKAKTATADLQDQLTKAKAQQSDLQTQLDQSKDASVQLQAQLDRAKAAAVVQQAQLDKSKAQAADLEVQLNQATAGSTQLLSQLDQAKIQSMDLQSRLQKAESDLAQLQPMLLKVGRMPVATSFEKESWGHGLTLHVNNLQQQPLTVNITIAGADNTRRQSNVIGAGATLNVEKLAVGDKVVIASDGFESLSLTAQ
jgi:multidrug efflux pump subunit AcrA (membrane-fusion protein)